MHLSENKIPVRLVLEMRFRKRSMNSAYQQVAPLCSLEILAENWKQQQQHQKQHSKHRYHHHHPTICRRRRSAKTGQKRWISQTLVRRVRLWIAAPDWQDSSTERQDSSKERQRCRSAMSWHRAHWGISPRRVLLKRHDKNTQEQSSSEPTTVLHSLVY